MKLNLRPNICELSASTSLNNSESRRRGRSICAAKIATKSLLYTLFIHHTFVTCYNSTDQLAAAQNTEFQKNHTSSGGRGRDVTNLHLTSDFRAVKLRWSYEHNDKNQPVSFDVRFCELTSWNIEIKCRHREMIVENGIQHQAINSASKDDSDFIATSSSSSNTYNKIKTMDNSVIKSPIVETVHQLDPPNGPHYEAQIYDLRALTNYTFQVQVSRFEHEPTVQLAATNNNNSVDTSARSSQLNGIAKRHRGQSARRLSADATSDQQLQQHSIRRIETKPFGAEATKCLADVSEVLINTGRYFGGRISVEDSTDPRCHLLGNKTSEQSSYLFRIDHEICASKTIDGSRIETMVLVHENKDILTHNTARFLVLCNFLQKSFTLRASVSLPKVNGIVPAASGGGGGGSRAAVITSLPSAKHYLHQASSSSSSDLVPVGAGDLSSEHYAENRVMLGSMPGIYRARVQHANSALQESGAAPLQESAITLKQQRMQQQHSPELINGADANRKDPFKQQHATTAAAAAAAVNNRQPLDELESSNTIERKFVVEKDSLPRGLLLLSNSNNSAEGQTAQVNATASASATPQLTSRQSKELSSSFNSAAAATRRNYSNVQIISAMDNSRARSLMLLAAPPDQANIQQAAESSSSKFLQQQQQASSLAPQPVQVQSKVLYIEPAVAPARVGKLQRHNLPLYNKLVLQQQQQHTTTNAMENSSQIDTPSAEQQHGQTATTSALSSPLPPLIMTPAAAPASSPSSSSSPSPATEAGNREARYSKQLANSNNNKLSSSLNRDQEDLQAAPIIITNNHRVGGDYLSPLAGRAGKLLADNSLGDNDRGNNFTIRYSANRVDDFPVGGVTNQQLVEFRNSNSNQQRVRSGRMRSLLGSGDVSSSLSKSAADFGQLQTTTAPDYNSLDRSSWSSVNRMGEAPSSSSSSAALDSDLMAETSNETVNQVVSMSQMNSTLLSPTLAQNITGALLRWSLKTLTNLARKSLESIISDNSTANPINEPYFTSSNSSQQQQLINKQLEQAGARWDSGQVLSQTTMGIKRDSQATSIKHTTTPLLNNAAITPPTTTRRSTTTTSSTIHKPTDTTSHISVAQGESIKLTSTPSTGGVQGEEIDGFITSGRTHKPPSPNEATTSTTATSTRQPHNTRPSNYSKSLDLNRGIDFRQRNTSEKHLINNNNNNNNRPTTGTAVNQQSTNSVNKQRSDHNQQQAFINESVWNNRDSFYSSWLFYGILLFVALVTAIFLTLCLVSSTSSPTRHLRQSNLDCDSAQGIRPLNFSCDSGLPGLVFGGGGGGGGRVLNSAGGQSSHLDSTYQKYDYNKFENYSSGTMNNHKHVAGSNSQQVSRLSQQSPSINGSQTITRSTSADSGTLLATDENDCKNQEFLYTEHVLINTGSSFGSESYA